MSLSLRKSLVATVTATALVFSGTTIATADEAKVKTTEDSSSESFSSSSDDEDDENKVTPQMIKEYIQIIVSIIRAMDGAMSLFPQPKK